ncbi:hypothetical protein [Arthrobacter sp. HY1533]|uniref:hypothetical protein n=1 Tax=Arthrobacter sp. HY1533 TaxID=2970919 RepID=UPI0022B9F466|nr:hypothetical protein [Arthrobacter sp. HY1533]
MESTTSDAHTHVGPGPSTAVPSAAEYPLRIRWGRTSMALVGLLALLVAGISGALSVFSLASAGVAWTSLAIFAAVVGGLRVLAIRDQSARRAARLAARTTAQQAATVSQAPAVEPRETELFDRAEGAEPAPVQKPLTAGELRAAAMRVAAKGTADAKLAHTQTLGESELEAETWEPVEVPVPNYVKAAKALSLEKPLNLPAAPKSAGTSIKADQAGIGVATGREGVAAVPDVEGLEGAAAVAKAPAAKLAVPASERGSYALNNLDDVLQRRRA